MSTGELSLIAKFGGLGPVSDGRPIITSEFVVITCPGLIGIPPSKCGIGLLSWVLLFLSRW